MNIIVFAVSLFLLIVCIFPFSVNSHRSTKSYGHKPYERKPSFQSNQSPVNGIVPNSFLIQLTAECGMECREEAQQLLRSNSRTKKCAIGSLPLTIGSLFFESIVCDRNHFFRQMKYMGSHYRRKSFQILIIKTIRVALARAGTRPLFIENSSTVRVQAVSYHYQMDGYTVSPPESFRTDLYGIDEVDGGFPRDGLRTCAQKSNNGKNVSIWILDTGCEPSPGGLCADFTGEQVGTCTDNDGHGTAMGQIASDAEFGVAPAATRHCLRVLVDTANGDWTNVLRGLAFVGAQNLKSKGKVINLSLSGPVASNSRSVPVILRELGRMGFFTVGAAGNDRSNACDQIPASFRGDRFFSVQAHDESGNPFSNNNFATTGSDCIDLSAPGVNIRTTPVAIAQDLGGSGTSHAAAHVSGAIAVLLSDNREVNMLSLTQNGRLIDNGMERGMSLVDKESLGLSCPQRRKTRKFSSSNRKGHRGY